MIGELQLGLNDDKKLISALDRSILTEESHSPVANSKLSILSEYNTENKHGINNSYCGEIYMYEDTVTYISRLKILEPSSINSKSSSNERYSFLIYV